MTWAQCPTHGPVQDATETRRAGRLIAVHCRCGLIAKTYSAPAGFVEHAELKELVQAKKPLPPPIVEASLTLGAEGRRYPAPKKKTPPKKKPASAQAHREP